MKESLLLQLDYCLTPTTRINNAAIVIRDGCILALGGYSAFVHPENYDLFEMPDCYALPGFIDTHISGAARFDSMHAASNPDLDEMSEALAAHGVTSFVPTTHSSPHDHLLAVVEALEARVDDDSLPGAIPAGLHIDGPFISVEKRGAHQEEYLAPIDLGKTREIIQAGRGKIKIFTFAPELEHAVKLSELLCEHDIVPCMGHTVAGYQQVISAIEAGASRCLHLYNGMEPLQQRKVGLAAIALLDDRVWVELIPDGVHSHWGMLDLACRCKAKDKLIAISNSTEAAGLPDGRYHLGDRVIIVKKGRVTLESGTIAGSANFLDQNYRNMLKHTYLSQEEVAACFTLNAAQSVGLHDRGRLKPGKRADLVILNQEHEVQLTLVNGRIVYSKDDRCQLPEAQAPPKESKKKKEAS